MKYAICNETFQDWPLDKAFAYAHQVGYTGIEIAPFTIDKDVRNISGEQRQQIRSLAGKHDLQVVGLHWLLAFTKGFYLTSPDPDIQLRTAAYLRELARLCHDLGGSICVLGSPKRRNLLPGVSLPQAMELAATTIRAAISEFEDLGVVLALEPLGPEEGDFLLTSDEGVRLMQMVSSPACRLHLDVKAMSSESQPIADNIRAHADAMVHFHANDANRRGPGMGEIDFVPILQALADIRYEGWVSVEVFDYAPGIEALATESLRNLQACWEKVRR